MSAAEAFRIEDYFAGRVHAEGLVEDRFGKVRRQFSVDIAGHEEDDEFVLDERFHFDDGEETHRIWRVRRTEAGCYEGRADDVVGIAHGAVKGSELAWRYRMRLPIGARVWTVGFDDRMFLRPGGVLINIADMSLWGIRIGRITIAFSRS